MDISDGIDKSWDHPWTTDEMRRKRREWSLAGDAGLLKHLQQFSENLVTKANKTQEALDLLTTELNETAILIDNVTNTSLALANTQFIESRVQEDDMEIEKKSENSQHDSRTQDTSAADLIACVSESVKQGLCIMDEKYKRMEVVDSDSEDEGDAILLSVILGPNNPYQYRPLPYVIGSEKWKASNKIGLESSSSESELLDDEEDEEETESEKEEVVRQPSLFNANAIPKINIARLSSSSSESDNYDDENNVAYRSNGKLDGLSHSNANSVSESTTPVSNLPKTQVLSEPSSTFAEELAKRLGTVRQSQKPPAVEETNEASINRYKDDLFTPEEEESASDNIFKPPKRLFDDQSSSNLWKEKPIKTFRTNIIPPSIDVPPPISTVSTKPKSAIDDLFADPDSEDSDDIFSSKSTIKKITREDKPDSKKLMTDNIQKKFLDTVTTATTSHMATSTPEDEYSNAKVSNLFSDDEDDTGDLFGASKKQLQKSDISPPVQNVNKKKPVGGVSILGQVLASDIENKLSNTALRYQWSDSSTSDTETNNGTGKNNEPISEDTTRHTTLNDNTIEQSSIVAGGNMPQNIPSIDNSYSSGISIQPPSINNTANFSIGADIQPWMTSTRLRSEEIYRERVVSDSLFASRTREPVSTATNSTNQTTDNQSQEQATESSYMHQDDVFENEDLFGPPPLPKSDSKPMKSKVSSLFDDSDSGDELFSTTSSGSRSQKSTDLLATTPQYPDRRTAHRKGLFDEDIDIFGNKDSPDVDIFGITSKPKEETKKPPEISNDLFGGRSRGTTSVTNDKVQNIKAKQPSLFDDDIDDGDLFGIKFPKNEKKSKTDLFKEEDEDDLFSTKKIDKKPAEKSLFTDKDAKSKDQVLKKPETKNTSENKLFSSAVNVHGLLFEDEEYDDLFGKKTTSDNEIKDTKAKAVETEVRSEPPKGTQSPKTEEKSIEASTSALESANTIATAESTAPESSPPIQTDVEEGKIQNITSDAVEEVTFENAKKSPPKTLNIRTASSSPPSEENSQAPRRTVSGKIKNLMGKVGDLKILSPMDTPPLWRKSEEKTDEEEDTGDRDSDDGGCISIQSRSSPPSTSESSAARKSSSPLTITGGSNVEVAISFDEPAQVETLSTVASKSRVRIQAKRRPQSRHARKSAIRQSGIDFDTVDTADDSQGDSSKELFNPNVASSVQTSATSDVERVFAPAETSRPDITLAIDDKSEIGSLSKESSMSANKNTLLSPSTDEEDLFDVPPDLPEDPQREDTLFGRAPILSPIENVSEKVPSGIKPLRDTIIGRRELSESNNETVKIDDKESSISSQDGNDSTQVTMHPSELSKSAEIQSSTENQKKEHFDKAKEQDVFDDESADEVIDPLRDSTHDPLKDPSQLFAFVTKTPSPEKGKSLLFSEDDSLFTSGPKKVSEKRAQKKQVLDLFTDDTGDDLFSAPLTKTVKKPLKETKISLFDDDNQDDEDDSLFGSIAKKTTKVETTQKIQVPSGSQKKTNFFDDDDNTNLFAEQTEQKLEPVKVPEPRKRELFSGEGSKASSLKDIFGDQSSGEDDIFATTKSVGKKTASSKSLFSSEDNKVKLTGNRPPVKKVVTRDLKKTAEKIMEDPLSLLQDD